MICPRTESIIVNMKKKCAKFGCALLNFLVSPARFEWQVLKLLLSLCLCGCAMLQKETKAAITAVVEALDTFKAHPAVAKNGCEALCNLVDLHPEKNQVSRG